MTEDERIQIIEEALANEYREIWLWKPTPISHPFGPDDLDLVARFSEHVRETREAFIEALRALTDDELTRIRDFSRKPMEISEWPWSKLLPDHRHPEELLNQTPSPWAYGFGHPAFRCDFQYWAKMPRLTLMEATLLSVGADPKTLSSKDIYKLKKARTKKLWASQQFLIERYDLLFRVFPSSQVGNGLMSTRSFYRWVKEAELEIHPDFAKALSRRFDDPLRTVVAAEATAAEKSSLLRMIAAMAIEQYGYVPSAQRNDAVKALCDDLDGLGIGLDPKTIRKWLKEACVLIDPENLPK